MCSNSPEDCWPLTGTALVVDDEPAVARACAGMLERAGCACSVAGSYREALAMLEDQPNIGLVITDHGVDGDNTEEFVMALRIDWPGIIVVGSSGSDCRSDMKRFGVDRCLMKPWGVEELIELLSGRFEKCAMCSIALPLRQPFMNEVGLSWECASCGCLYRAVLDHDAHSETFRNVRCLE